MLHKLWTNWKAIVVQLGNLWARVVFTVFYFLIVTPFALTVRLLSDPLGVKRRDDISFWHPKTLPQPTLEEARRQF